MPLALALALAAGSDPTSEADRDASARATLDVLVTDRAGRAVETLTADEFSIVSQGLQLRVDAARFVHPPRRSLPPGSTSAPVDTLDAGQSIGPDTRLFGILLDEYHVSAGPAAARVRDALIRFVTEDLGPGDWVALVKPLDSLSAISLTSDREAVARAIAGFDPRRGDYAPRTSFEREFIGAAPSSIDAARAQIVTASLTALATHLGRYQPTRKTLIFVTEGFAPRGARPGGPPLAAFGAAASTANRAHVAIYPLNPSDELGSEASGAPTRIAAVHADEGLRRLAAETNGRTAGSPRDLGAMLKSALDDAAGYYELTVSALEKPETGQWRTVDVRVGRRDLLVRARLGYWQPGASRSQPPDVGGPFLSAFSARFPRRSSGLIRPWFGLSRGDSDATRVSFVWEPAPRVPGDRTPPPAAARIVLSVTTLDGALVFEGAVLPANASATRGGAEPSLAAFDATSGRFLVQMVIEDASSRVIDRDVRDLVVGGFPGPVSLGTAEVLRARTEREYRAIAANPAATPVAARQFSRAERLIARVPVYSGALLPTVSARLVSGLGGLMGELSMAPMPDRRNVYQIDVPLAALAAGNYSIEVSARTAEGEARDTLPIRVTP